MHANQNKKLELQLLTAAQAKGDPLAPSTALNLQLLPIPAGSFQMGSARGDYAEGLPVMQVRLSSFWLGRTEVTQAQWAAVMGDEPSSFAGGDRPVERVSWDDAMEFCRRVTEQERAAGRLPAGHAYTLPTEAQWEYACRAGTTEDDVADLDAIAWHGENSGAETHPVATKQANAWGLYDMYGNVWEWCRDWYAKYPGGSATDPSGPAVGALRVRRGGSWRLPSGFFFRENRHGLEPSIHSERMGFRLALAPSP
jgi:formylglycine-generating enzyme required for sulfatase activity